MNVNASFLSYHLLKISVPLQAVLILFLKLTLLNSTFPNSKNQKQPSRGVLSKRCSKNMQQIYRRIPMPMCDFNKVAFQLY